MSSQRRGGLGRGLGALLPSTEPSVSQEAAKMVSILAVQSNPHHPVPIFEQMNFRSSPIRFVNMELSSH